MARHGLFRAAVVAALTAVALPGGVAVAAANTPPSQPVLSELLTGGKACAAGDDRPYVPTAPRLSAVLRDPDAGSGVSVRLGAEFEATWADAAGQTQTRSYTSGTTYPSGLTVYWTMPSDIPADTVISWRVRATDGTAWSPWSSENGQGECEFVYDDTAPDKPVVTADGYPDDDTWHDGVGVYGSFTFDSPSDDVVKYVYNFIGGPYGTAVPDEPGSPATIRFMPTRSGPDYVTVRAVDRSGRSSTTVTSFFRVAEGRAPVGDWELTDAAGSATAADSGSGAHDAVAGAGVKFGKAAPSGTGLASAAAFDGGPDARLAPGAAVVDTSKTFAFSAWALPAAAGRDMTAVGQGDVRLGLSGGAWSFDLGDGVHVTGGSPSDGEWAHLTGVYDAEAGTATLYVNGTSVGTTQTPAAPPAPSAPSASSAESVIGVGWHGRLAAVRAWDRVVVPAEAAGLAVRAAHREGYWQLNSASDGAAPEYSGGQPLTLAGDAAIYTPESTCDIFDPDCVPPADPLVGAGDLALDGDGDHAAAAGPVVDTDESFSLTAHVRLTDAEPGHDMALFAIPGEHANAVVLRWSASAARWELAMAHADAADAATTSVRASASLDWDSRVQSAVAVVYDDAADEIRLYVDGQLQSTAEAALPSALTWKAAGPLQLGRALTADGTWGDYLAGHVDDVHAYSGVLTATAISQLASPIELPDN